MILERSHQRSLHEEIEFVQPRADGFPVGSELTRLGFEEELLQGGIDPADYTIPGVAPFDIREANPSNATGSSIFNVNGASNQLNNTCIDGASTTNIWQPQYTAYAGAGIHPHRQCRDEQL
jgi:hypothetical protein